MKRIDFLRSIGGLSSLAVIACKTENVVSGGTSGTTNGSSASNCAVSPSETEGPFPTHDPANYKIQDITSDRKGVLMTMAIAIKNKNATCAILKDAIVDIWYCDAEGLYSEYGGSGMQSVNLTTVHFLRGRQITDSSGLVTFKGIFPGWYSGRAPHIHVHVYNASGKSLLVTQIAFPKEVCDNVYKNATTFYKKGTADTTNERDNVFSDGFANELAGLTGSIATGYTLNHSIVVNA